MVYIIILELETDQRIGHAIVGHCDIEQPIHCFHVCVIRLLHYAKDVLSHKVCTGRSINQSINHACIFRVVQVTKSLQDPLEVGNNLPGISDNVRE